MDREAKVIAWIGVVCGCLMFFPGLVGIIILHPQSLPSEALRRFQADQPNVFRYFLTVLPTTAWFGFVWGLGSLSLLKRHRWGLVVTITCLDILLLGAVCLAGIAGYWIVSMKEYGSAFQFFGIAATVLSLLVVGIPITIALWCLLKITSAT